MTPDVMIAVLFGALLHACWNALIRGSTVPARTISGRATAIASRACWPSDTVTTRNDSSANVNAITRWVVTLSSASSRVRMTPAIVPYRMNGGPSIPQTLARAWAAM